jgi:hypothetical protein
MTFKNGLLNPAEDIEQTYNIYNKKDQLDESTFYKGIKTRLHKPKANS